MASHHARGTMLCIIATAAVLMPASLGAHADGCRVAPGVDAVLEMPGLPVRADAGLEGLEVVPPGLAPPSAPDTHGCTGKIQPGAQIGPISCTMNWIFRDAEDRLYVGMAGHCAVVGFRVTTPDIGAFGTVVFTTGPNGGVGNDFGLARIDPEFEALVDPTLCHWGGPNGAGLAGASERVLVYGQGFIWGELPATRPRAGVSAGTSGTTITYVGLAQPGDSGMPIMDESGDAVGIHTHSLGPNVVPVRADPSVKYGTSVLRAIALGSAGLGTPLSLVTSEVPVSLTGTG